MRSEIAMMRIPGAPGRLELAKYHSPTGIILALAEQLS
jgi:hypothetical protein